jgi:hypothetical protein
MRFVTKYETDQEIFAIVAIEKEPLKVSMMVDEVRVEDIPDEQVIQLIKEQI